MAESYRKAGVDLQRMEALKAQIAAMVRTTWTPQVTSPSAAFSGTVRWVPGAANMLAATTDGVGTKTLLASAFGRWDVIGTDIVNHCLNDLLCSGAEPLFFMDYIALSNLDEVAVLEVVRSMVSACVEAGCPILGGETALMPDVYSEGALEVAGTMVGALSEPDRLGPDRVQSRDVLVALPSSGLHTNGYSLVRRLFSRDEMERYQPELGDTLVGALLLPHRSYLREVRMAKTTAGLHAAAHITGGGLPGNLPRVLPDHLMATIDTGSWEVPPVFKMIQHKGKVATEEMFEIFNMGIGMVLVMDTVAAVEVLSKLPEAWIVGEVLPAPAGKPRLQFER